jgi:hypothetical protein
MPALSRRAFDLLHKVAANGGSANVPAPSYEPEYDELEQAKLVKTATAGVNVVVVELTNAGRDLIDENRSR